MHFTNPKFQAFDGNGNPLSGGKLYTYAGGGSTARTTYSTRDCATTENANPIVLDSRGECVIYGKGLYKFVLKDANGVTIWSFDDLLLSGESIWDAARQTGWQTEETWGEDILRADTGGTQRGLIDAGGFQETVSATNYKLANFRELWGLVDRSQFLWGDATSLLIEPGAYWCQEKYCSWALQLDLTVGTLTSGKWYDVYLDHSTITSGTVLTNANLRYVLEDTEVATWNDTYRGWYSDTTAADRCIFGFYADGANTMDEFFHDGGDLVMYADAPNSITDQSVKNAWEDAEAALFAPSFATKILATLLLTYADATAIGYWRTKGQTATAGHTFGAVINAIATEASNTTSVITDSSQMIQLYTSAATDQTINIYTDGYFFPKGM